MLYKTDGTHGVVVAMQDQGAMQIGMNAKAIVNDPLTTMQWR